jgi:hypothetical protein
VICPGSFCFCGSGVVGGDGVDEGADVEGFGAVGEGVGAELSGVDGGKGDRAEGEEPGHEPVVMSWSGGGAEDCAQQPRKRISAVLAQNCLTLGG